MPAGIVAVGGAPTTVSRRRFPWLAALLWLLFVALLLAAGGLLLRSCAIGSEHWPAVLRSWLPDRCPPPPAPQASPEVGRIEASVRALERDVAARDAACGVSCPATTPPPRQAPPVPPPQPAPAEIDRRLDQQGSTRGRYLEVTLAWNGTHDLDLFVICPNGQEIAFNSPANCKGRLVTDLNADESALVNTPIEHVIWDEAPSPDGTYRVDVSYFSNRSSPAGAVEFTVIVRREGTIVAQRQGTVASPGQKTTALTFSVPLSR